MIVLYRDSQPDRHLCESWGEAWELEANHTMTTQSPLPAGESFVTEQKEKDMASRDLSQAHTAVTSGKSAYEALKAMGHSPAKAAEIVLNASRGDEYSRDWIAMALATGPEQ